MSTVAAIRAKERRGIQTALCGPVLALGNLWVVQGAWGPVMAAAGICLAVGIGIIVGANGDQIDEPENPNVTRLLTNASTGMQALMAEAARLKQRCDVLQDENETLARRLDAGMARNRMAQERATPLFDLETGGIVIRQDFGLVTQVMGCKTCAERGCAACDRHAWVAREEEQGWPSM